MPSRWWQGKAPLQNGLMLGDRAQVPSFKVTMISSAATQSWAGASELSWYLCLIRSRSQPSLEKRLRIILEAPKRRYASISIPGESRTRLRCSCSSMQLTMMKTLWAIPATSSISRHRSRLGTILSKNHPHRSKMSNSKLRLGGMRSLARRIGS